MGKAEGFLLLFKPFFHGLIQNDTLWLVSSSFLLPGGTVEFHELSAEKLDGSLVPPFKRSAISLREGMSIGNVLIPIVNGILLQLVKPLLHYLFPILF